MLLPAVKPCAAPLYSWWIVYGSHPLGSWPQISALTLVLAAFPLNPIPAEMCAQWRPWVAFPGPLLSELQGPGAAHPHGLREERPGSVPGQLLLLHSSHELFAGLGS